MKNKEYILKFIVVILAFVLMFFAGKSLKAYLTQKNTQNIVDVSDNKYISNRFNDNCNSGFKYSVRNKDDILYVNGTSIYRYSDNQSILTNININKMLYTDSYLYVLDDSNALHIIDMKQSRKYELSDVEDFEYDGYNLYFQRVITPNGNPEDDYIVYMPESEIIKNDAVVIFNDMYLIDGQLCVERCVYGNDGARYWTLYDEHKRSLVRKATAEQSLNESASIEISASMYFLNNSLAVTNDNTYLLCAKYNEGAGRYTQDVIDYDIIYELDFDSKQANEIYRTDNNLNRIVGFDDEKNIVYLYDVNNNQINALDLNTNQTEKIDTLQRKYNSLIFDMSKDVLFVYTDNNELVKIVELNN